MFLDVDDVLAQKDAFSTLYLEAEENTIIMISVKAFFWIIKRIILFAY